MPRSGQWAIYFRVVLSDDAAKHRLQEVVTDVEWRLAERLDFAALGVFPYHNFRSESEQAALLEEAWAYGKSGAASSDVDVRRATLRI